MKLEITFVGVKANALLHERIYEHLEQLLGERLPLIESIQLRIGRDLESIEERNVQGHGLVTLTTGGEFQVTNDDSKLMVLIDRCIEELNEFLPEEVDPDFAAVTATALSA